MPAPVPCIFKLAVALSENPPHFGLYYRYYGGNILTSTGFKKIPQGAVLLPDNTSQCYVQCLDNGEITYSLNGFMANTIPMAIVQTENNYVIRWQDLTFEYKISNPFGMGEANAPNFVDVVLPQSYGPGNLIPVPNYVVGQHAGENIRLFWNGQWLTPGYENDYVEVGTPGTISAAVETRRFLLEGTPLGISVFKSTP